ncbi:hypothetical protein EWM64_g2869 [Hericium alpestre]|uniref:BTB domain-containing protein n=1 Tax=Hericium alpestre TaxID=135208 RepID=A0A4Z0A479_9AGAM|nr:hypothetical protein EWM64_g2869 [Hericium alpestre]
MPEELKASPVIPRLTVPKDLLDSVGSLLDDPLYSDVEFELPRRHGGLGNARKIYASKKLLSRADYFDTMFNSGFAETSDQTQVTLPTEETASLANDGASDTNSFHASFDDSDDEDEEVTEAGGTDTPRFDFEQVDERTAEANATPPQSNEQPAAEPTTSPREGNEDREDGEGEGNDLRNVRLKLQHPSSPRTSPERLGRCAGPAAPASGPPKLRVIVKDVAYSTYRAILYYVSGPLHPP